MSFRPHSSRHWVAAVALVAVFASGCAGDRPTLEQSGASRQVDESDTSTTLAGDGDDGLLRLAVGASWNSDPANAGPTGVASRIVAGLVFEGLTRLDRNGQAEPALAERWQVSEDRLRWTFVLRDGLTDNLGLALTARDAKASLERLAERGATDQIVAQLSSISGWDALVSGASGGAAGIVAADERTLIIDLDSPFEPLPLVLAEPAYGITGIAADGSVRTTGDYTFGTSDTELVAIDSASSVPRIELIVAEQSGGELLRSGSVDWAVLDGADDPTTLPGTILRQPLPLRIGLVVRLANGSQRAALFGALNAPELAFELDEVTVAIVPPSEARPEALPATIDVVLPSGPLAELEDELVAQLDAAGVTANVAVLEATMFAEAVASGDAGIFPLVLPGAGFARSIGVSVAEPGGVDDVFGVSDAIRTGLIQELFAETDSVARAVLADAVEDRLHAEHLWLPIATSEVQVGLSERMALLRLHPDGTFDLSGF